MTAVKSYMAGLTVCLSHCKLNLALEPELESVLDAVVFSFAIAEEIQKEYIGAIKTLPDTTSNLATILGNR